MCISMKGPNLTKYFTICYPGIINIRYIQGKVKENLLICDICAIKFT